MIILGWLLLVFFFCYLILSGSLIYVNAQIIIIIIMVSIILNGRLDYHGVILIRKIDYIDAKGRTKNQHYESFFLIKQRKTNNNNESSLLSVKWNCKVSFKEYTNMKMDKTMDTCKTCILSTYIFTIYIATESYKKKIRNNNF